LNSANRLKKLKVSKSTTKIVELKDLDAVDLKRAKFGRGTVQDLGERNLFGNVEELISTRDE
jgi:hypothetical protein